MGIYIRRYILYMYIKGGRIEAHMGISLGVATTPIRPGPCVVAVVLSKMRSAAFIDAGGGTLVDTGGGTSL